jgi:hypothetical protein
VSGAGREKVAALRENEEKQKSGVRSRNERAETALTDYLFFWLSDFRILNSVFVHNSTIESSRSRRGEGVRALSL